MLPTGRNFYSVDSRAVPTPAAWELGKKSAELLVTRYAQDHGEWPTSFGITAWGTSNMRTGGDDIAQALALIGAKPVWDTVSRRVTGYEIIPPAMLRRPRVDVTLRISGFFRDAFPEQIALFDRAVRAIGALDEDSADNPIAARMRAEAAALAADGASAGEAVARAGYRVFGAKPGSYGAGLQTMIDEGLWQDRGDLAEAWLAWGAHAYAGEGEDVLNARVPVAGHQVHELLAGVAHAGGVGHGRERLLPVHLNDEVSGGLPGGPERAVGDRDERRLQPGELVHRLLEGHHGFGRLGREELERPGGAGGEQVGDLRHRGVPVMVTTGYGPAARPLQPHYGTAGRWWWDRHRPVEA